LAQQPAAARQTPITTTCKSDNVRHLCRMGLPGGGQIVIQGKFSTITDCPSSSLKHGANIRTSPSLPPPAASGTTG